MENKPLNHNENTNPPPEETVPLPRKEPMENFVERRIQQAMEEGLFDDLSAAGKPLPGINGSYDPNWWIKQLLRRERFRTDEMNYRIRIDEIREKIPQESDEDVLRSLLHEMNGLVIKLNKMGTNVLPSNLAPVDVEKTLQRLAGQFTDRNHE